jgi:hypothetical protein
MQFRSDEAMRLPSNHRMNNRVQSDFRKAAESLNCQLEQCHNLNATAMDTLETQDGTLSMYICEKICFHRMTEGVLCVCTLHAVLLNGYLDPVASHPPTEPQPRNLWAHNVAPAGTYKHAIQDG